MGLTLGCRALGLYSEATKPAGWRLLRQGYTTYRVQVPQGRAIRLDDASDLDPRDVSAARGLGQDLLLPHDAFADVVIDRVYVRGTTVPKRGAYLLGRHLADLHRPVQTGFDVKLVGAGIGLRRHENLAWLARLLQAEPPGALTQERLQWLVDEVTNRFGYPRVDVNVEPDRGGATSARFWYKPWILKFYKSVWGPLLRLDVGHGLRHVQLQLLVARLVFSWGGQAAVLDRVTDRRAVGRYAEDHPQRLDPRERALALLLLNRNPSRWQERNDAIRQHDKAKNEFARALRNGVTGALLAELRSGVWKASKIRALFDIAFGLDPHEADAEAMKESLRLYFSGSPADWEAGRDEWVKWRPDGHELSRTPAGVHLSVPGTDAAASWQAAQRVPAQWVLPRLSTDPGVRDIEAVHNLVAVIGDPDLMIDVGGGGVLPAWVRQVARLDPPTGTLTPEQAMLVAEQMQGVRGGGPVAVLVDLLSAHPTLSDYVWGIDRDGYRTDVVDQVWEYWFFSESLHPRTYLSAAPVDGRDQEGVDVRLKDDAMVSSRGEVSAGLPWSDEAIVLGVRFDRATERMLLDGQWRDADEVMVWLEQWGRDASGRALPVVFVVGEAVPAAGDTAPVGVSVEALALSFGSRVARGRSTRLVWHPASGVGHVIEPDGESRPSANRLGVTVRDELGIRLRPARSEAQRAAGLYGQLFGAHLSDEDRDLVRLLDAAAAGGGAWLPASGEQLLGLAAEAGIDGGSDAERLGLLWQAGRLAQAGGLLHDALAALAGDVADTLRRVVEAWRAFEVFQQPFHVVLSDKERELLAWLQSLAVGGGVWGLPVSGEQLLGLAASVGIDGVAAPVVLRRLWVAGRLVQDGRFGLAGGLDALRAVVAASARGVAPPVAPTGSAPLWPAAVAWALPLEDAFSVVLRTLDRDVVLARMAVHHPSLPGVQAYRQLLGQKLPLPSELWLDGTAWFDTGLSLLPDDRSRADVAAVFAPAPGWDELTTDVRPLREIVAGTAAEAQLTLLRRCRRMGGVG